MNIFNNQQVRSRQHSTGSCRELSPFSQPGSCLHPAASSFCGCFVCTYHYAHKGRCGQKLHLFLLPCLFSAQKLFLKMSTRCRMGNDVKRNLAVVLQVVTLQNPQSLQNLSLWLNVLVFEVFLKFFQSFLVYEWHKLSNSVKLTPECREYIRDSWFLPQQEYFFIMMHLWIVLGWIKNRKIMRQSLSWETNVSSCRSASWFTLWFPPLLLTFWNKPWVLAACCHSLHVRTKVWFCP